MDYAKKLKRRFRARDLDLQERRDIPVVGKEEGVARTNVCPCGTTTEKSWIRIPGECDIYKEERDALEDKIKILNEYDMVEEFRRLESSEKTIAILGDRWWPQTSKQDGHRISKQQS